MKNYILIIALYSSLYASQEVHQATGKEVFADLYGCQLSHLEPDMERVVGTALEKACATLCNSCVKPFSFVEDLNGTMVQGFTAAFILSESHLTIHTYPEVGYVAINIFTCGTHTKPEEALKVLIDYFKPRKKIVRVVPRGNAAIECGNAELE